MKGGMWGNSVQGQGNSKDEGSGMLTARQV